MEFLTATDLEGRLLVCECLLTHWFWEKKINDQQPI